MFCRLKSVEQELNLLDVCVRVVGGRHPRIQHVTLMGFGYKKYSAPDCGFYFLVNWEFNSQLITKRTAKLKYNANNSTTLEEDLHEMAVFSTGVCYFLMDSVLGKVL